MSNRLYYSQYQRQSTSVLLAHHILSASKWSHSLELGNPEQVPELHFMLLRKFHTQGERIEANGFTGSVFYPESTLVQEDSSWESKSYILNEMIFFLYLIVHLRVLCDTFQSFPFWACHLRDMQVWANGETMRITDAVVHAK